MLLIIKERELGRHVFANELLPIAVAQLIPELGARVEEVEELGGVRLHNPWAESDTEVPGLLDRRAKLIIVAKKEPLTEQRYTMAHEVAHLLYHADAHHLRERAARVMNRDAGDDGEFPNHRREEREAEIFAAELLMPPDLTREAMVQRFGAPIDGTLPRDELAYHLSNAIGRKLDAFQLARMPQESRAALFAEATSFVGRFFEPLIRQFGVSKQAMAIRLLELGLVS